MSQCHDTYDLSEYPGPEETVTDTAPSCHDTYPPAESATAGRAAPSRPGRVGTGGGAGYGR